MSKPRGIMEDHTDYVRHQVERLTPSSAGVEFHLKLTQDVVARMARNSALTKTWCATLVAAIMVLVARTEVPIYLWVAVVPIVLLCFVDTKPIPRWDVHFGGLEDDLKDSTALHLTFTSQLGATDSAV